MVMWFSSKSELTTNVQTVNSNSVFHCYCCNGIFHGHKDQIVERMNSHDEEQRSETITNEENEVQSEKLRIIIL